MGGNNSKPEEKEVYYNKLPALVHDWDDSRAQQVQQFQASVVSRSAAFPKSEREKHGSFHEESKKASMTGYNKNGIYISNYMSENFAEDDE